VIAAVPLIRGRQGYTDPFENIPWLKGIFPGDRYNKMFAGNKMKKIEQLK
jgi:hypothetical protein